MGLDALAKRYFPAVVCLLVAMAAYFQASAMGQIVAGSIAVDASSRAPMPVAPRHKPAPQTNPDHTTSAAAILSRNPFDSVTGPLDGTPVDFSIAPPTPAVDDNDWTDDPACDSARVILITASDDPAWSFAAMAGSDGKTMLRRQGDEIGSQTVAFVGWDRVWLKSGTSRCQSKIHDQGTVKPAASPAAAIEPTPSKGRGKKVPPEIAAKIHKISDNEFDVERGVVDTILENQAELMRSARIVPEKEGDKIVGIRLFGIRPDSLLGTLGLENGDRLQTINGFDMASPEKALEAYARLRTADRLTVTVNRRGKAQNIDFNIK